MSGCHRVGQYTTVVQLYCMYTTVVQLYHVYTTVVQLYHLYTCGAAPSVVPYTPDATYVSGALTTIFRAVLSCTGVGLYTGR